ncbi:LPS export ABC transporter periplasmic protein LptC [bacterium]|nr:MAG: LPS export ABC transporter periplasmic protein LptC [bacterium]
MNGHLREGGYALAMLLMLAGCRPPAPSPPPLPPPTTATPAITGAVSTFPPLRVSAHGSAKAPVVIESFRADGSKRYRLEARSAVYDNAHRRARFRSAHVIFYRGARTLTVDAPAALVDHNSQTVTMDGGVRAVSDDGVVLSCRRMVYHSTTDHVTGDGDVRMRSGSDVLTGGHLESDLRLEQVTVSP